MCACQLYDFVLRKIFLTMHIAPGNRDLLHFLASVARKFARPAPFPGGFLRNGRKLTQEGGPATLFKRGLIGWVSVAYRLKNGDHHDGTSEVLHFKLVLISCRIRDECLPEPGGVMACAV